MRITTSWQLNGGAPPKVIWLRGCDNAAAVAEELIRSQAIRIMDFLQAPDGAVLVLPRR
jgi:predicted nuclease of predicted toxin-antitoxin system